MEKKENSRSCINVYTASISNGLKVSSNDMQQVISATNNRAQLYAEQSKKYRDESKEYRDNAKYYAEQNSDVTLDYINNVQVNLEQKINSKQPVGNYALKEELPSKLGDLINDVNYVNLDFFNSVIDEVRLPAQDEQVGKFLKTDGESCYWASVNSFALFDTKLTDKLLSYEESKGWALQGTYVYKEPLAGSRYGYPDFYNKCLEEYAEATNTETVNGVTVKVHSNGHKFYDIADKTAIDNYFNSIGSAWFYGVDTANERILLPRNNWFEQATVDTTQVAKSVGAGLPDHRHDIGLDNYNGSKYGTRETSTSSKMSGYGQAGANTKSGYTSYASELNSIYGKSNTVQPPSVKKLLYICVGNTTNYEGVTDVVNQGMDILEQVNECIESRVKLDGSNAQFKYITQTYVSGTSGYRIWSDKYCEQWGVSPNGNDQATVTVTLLKAFKDSNYNVLSVQRDGPAGNYTNGIRVLNYTTESFQLNYRTGGATTAYWRACGYIA